MGLRFRCFSQKSPFVGIVNYSITISWGNFATITIRILQKKNYGFHRTLFHPIAWISGQTLSKLFISKVEDLIEDWWWIKQTSSFSLNISFALEFRFLRWPYSNVKLKTRFHFQNLAKPMRSILNTQTADLTMNRTFFLNFKILCFFVDEALRKTVWPYPNVLYGTYTHTEWVKRLVLLLFSNFGLRKKNRIYIQ